MTLSSLPSLVALLLLAAVFPLIRHVRWRQALLAACSSAVLWSIVPNLGSWLALALFVLSGYVVATLLILRRSRAILAAYLVTLIASFVVIRKYDFVMAWLPAPLSAHAIVIVGLSYMLFRQIHFLIDAAQGQVERPNLWTYANYQLNLFTILSGPIQRYQEFSKQWSELQPRFENNHNLQLSFLRLMIGYVKLAVIAPVFLNIYNSHLAVFASGAPLSAASLVMHYPAVLYGFPIYLYLNFSGYCDIVIAAATLVGLRLPENFDRPYLSRNVIDFWTRFHRTLGFWIRDYLFLPLYKGVAERWPKKADSLAFLCYFVAFLVAGTWHGPTANFVVYGLFQAVGVSAAKLWERHLIKRRGRAGLKEYMKSTRVRVIAIIATLHFECLSLLFFPNDVRTALMVIFPHMK